MKFTEAQLESTCFELVVEVNHMLCFHFSELKKMMIEEKEYPRMKENTHA